MQQPTPQLYTVPLTPPVTGVFPDEGNPVEPLTIYGTALTVDQLRRSCPRSTTRWLMVSMTVLLVIFAISAIEIAYYYVGEVETAFLSMLMVTAATMAFIARRRNLLGEMRTFRRRWQVYAAGAQGGLTTVWYPDRVEQFSPYCREVVTFSPSTRYTEHADFFTVTDGAHTISLRAADLTPTQAQAVYERICAVIPPERQFADGRFAAGRAVPLPPPFPVNLTQYEQFTYTPQAANDGMLPDGLVPWLLSLALVIAGMLTTLFEITPYFVADYLIFFVPMFLVAAGVSIAWLSATRSRFDPVPVTFIFTDAGLRIAQGNITRFVAAADVYARRTADGATMITPAGNFTFPWNATHNRQQVEWMLFGR